jgi:hypothetical protein
MTVRWEDLGWTGHRQQCPSRTVSVSVRGNLGIAVDCKGPSELSGVLSGPCGVCVGTVGVGVAAAPEQPCPHFVIVDNAILHPQSSMASPLEVPHGWQGCLWGRWQMSQDGIVEGLAYCGHGKWPDSRSCAVNG